MYKIVDSIEVGLPIEVVYNAWTRFEDFPDFIRGIEDVHWLDGDRMRWRINISGQRYACKLRVTERVPNERISWASLDGTGTGTVALMPISERSTWVRLRMEFVPDASIGGRVTAADSCPTGTLVHFKRFIESRPAGAVT